MSRPAPSTQSLATNVGLENNIPTWLNLSCIALIMGTGLYGAYLFFGQPPEAPLEVSVHYFVPCGVLFSAWGGLLFITSLFQNYDLATVMFLILLVLAIVLAGVAASVQDESTKGSFKDLAVAIAGLALGIPFGEKLRKGVRT